MATLSIRDRTIALLDETTNLLAETSKLPETYKGARLEAHLEYAVEALRNAYRAAAVTEGARE